MTVKLQIPKNVKLMNRAGTRHCVCHNLWYNWL